MHQDLIVKLDIAFCAVAAILFVIAAAKWGVDK